MKGIDSIKMRVNSINVKAKTTFASYILILFSRNFQSVLAFIRYCELYKFSHLLYKMICCLTGNFNAKVIKLK